MIAALYRPREVAAVEIQPAMAAMIRRSAALNHLECIRVVESDLRAPKIQGIAPGGFDLVVANPPFRVRGTGRESPDPGRRIARSEAQASIADFVRAAARHARFGGMTGFVFLADRCAELFSELRSCRLEPKRVRFVHPYRDSSATTVLVEARKGGSAGMKVEPPLIMYEAPHLYSAEARALLEEERT